MKLGWKMEVLFSGILLLAKFSGVTFEGEIWWVPVFALAFGGATLVFAFVRFMKARNVLMDAKIAQYYLYGIITSLMMSVAGIVAL